MFQKLCVPGVVHIKSLRRSSGLWNAVKSGQEQGTGNQRPREQWGAVCCHLAASADYFKMKPFGAIASLGNLAEHSSHFIPTPPNPVLIRHCMGVVWLHQTKAITGDSC